MSYRNDRESPDEAEQKAQAEHRQLLMDRNTLSREEVDLVLMIRKANEARHTLGMRTISLKWIFEEVKKALALG